MKVFISWSGRRSKRVAKILHAEMELFLPYVKPFFSEDSIQKGTLWREELHAHILRTQCCIICVTEESLHSPWMYYEAGALSYKGEDTLILPFLLDSAAVKAKGPLEFYQSVQLTKDDFGLMLRSINRQAGEMAVSERVLSTNLDTHWHALHEQIVHALGEESPAADCVRKYRAQMEKAVMSGDRVQMSWDDFDQLARELKRKIDMPGDGRVFSYDIILGVNKGGLLLANLLSRMGERSNRMVALPLYGVRRQADGGGEETAFEMARQTVRNGHIIDYIAEYRKSGQGAFEPGGILLVDSVSRNGVALRDAASFLRECLPDLEVRTAVLFVDERRGQAMQCDYCLGRINTDGLVLPYQYDLIT